MGARVDLSACRACHCLAARQHARAITRLFEEKLRPHGLRATQFSVLAALALKGPTPVRELAEFLGLDPHTVARGRQQLLDQNVSTGRTRRSGGGRKPVEKKPPTSSR